SRELEGYFYGMEDASGYAPLYTVAHARAARPPAPPLPRSVLLDGKFAALRRFLALAQTLGCRVVLFSSPDEALAAGAALYDDVGAALSSEFRGVSLLRMNEYPLNAHDFDEGGHLNLRGADKIGTFLAERVGLTRGDVDAKV